MDDAANDTDDASGGMSTEERYSYGRHTLPDETSEDALRDAAATRTGDESDLLDEAAKQYEEMDKEPRAYECTVCGLGHSHKSRKHDIRPIFNVRDEFATQMRYEPRCHCGVNELAVYVDHIDKVGMRVFTDRANDEVDARLVEQVRSAADAAPIDAETRQTIETIRASFESDADPDVGGTYSLFDSDDTADDDGPSPATNDDLDDVVERIIEKNPAAVWEYSSGRAPDEAMDALRRKVFDRIDWEATPEAVDQALQDAIDDADPSMGDPFSDDD